MSLKYYHAENAGRGYIGGVVFGVYDIVAGSAFGIYATEDERLQGVLDSLVADRASAVTSLSASDYEQCLVKKKPPNWPASPDLRQILSPEKAFLKGRAAGVVSTEPVEEPEKPLVIPDTLEKSEDALELAAVAIPEPVVVSAPMIKNRVKGQRETQ